MNIYLWPYIFEHFYEHVYMSLYIKFYIMMKDREDEYHGHTVCKFVIVYCVSVLNKCSFEPFCV